MNDELSMKNKSKTTAQSDYRKTQGEVPLLGLSEEVLESLQSSHFSDSQSAQSGHKKLCLQNMSNSGHSGSGKHGASEAETGVRTSQTPSQESHQLQPVSKDWLVESNESLKVSVGQCRDVFEYVYDDENQICDQESFKKMAKLSRDMDKLMAESLEDSQLNDDLTAQMESLEELKKMMQDRDQQRLEMAHLADDFKRMSNEVADMPEDFDQVAERVSEQVLADRRAGRLVGDGLQSHTDEQESGSQLMKAVQGKLMSTFYGFAKDEASPQTVKQKLDVEYQKGLQRIRELDRELALKEREEKNVREMIRLNRQKERELELEIRVSTPATLEDNTSGVTIHSSKSDFFPTQPKRDSRGNTKNLARQMKDSQNTSNLGPGRRVRKLPSRPSSQHQTKPTARDEALQHSVDFIRRNIEGLNMTDHERFVSRLDAKGKSRYTSLLSEIEAGLDSDDPEEFRRVSQLHYENIYNYPQELQDKFSQIDERIVDMLAQDDAKAQSKLGPKDILRSVVEQKEAKKRIKQIDADVEKIRNGEMDPSVKECKAILDKEMSLVDAETLQSIKDTIDLA